MAFVDCLTRPARYGAELADAAWPQFLRPLVLELTSHRPIREVLPGIHHWTAIHPRIKLPVDSYYLEPARVVLDPLVPREGLGWFVGRATPSQIVLTNRHHLRHSERYAEAFGCAIHCCEAGLQEFENGPRVEGFAFGEELARGITAYQLGVICPDDTALHIHAVDGGALAFADGLARPAWRRPSIHARIPTRRRARARTGRATRVASGTARPQLRQPLVRTRRTAHRRREGSAARVRLRRMTPQRPARPGPRRGLGRLRRLQRAEDVALGVFEVGDGADAGYLRGLDHLLTAGCRDAPPSFSQILDLDRVDIGRYRLAVYYIAAPRQSAVNTRFVVRASRDQPIVDRRSLPVVDPPAEDVGIEALGPIEIAAVNLENG